MKLLLENFKRYINEQAMFGGEGMSEGGYSEEEAAYFKDLPQIAEQISNAFDKFLKELNELYKQPAGIVEIQKNVLRFVRYADEMTGNKAKYVGHGKFRCVFDIGDEYVIKFDITPNNAAAEQNKTDAELGRMSQSYHNLFPLSVISHKDYRWVALEKVRPFESFDVKEFNQFFPNSVIEEMGITNDAVINKLIQISFVFNSRFRKNAFEMYADLLTKLSIVQAEKLKKVSLKKISNAFMQGTLYNNVISVIDQLRIRPQEVRLANTGKAPDGRFVILDSSIDAQIISSVAKSKVQP